MGDRMSWSLEVEVLHSTYGAMMCCFGCLALLSAWKAYLSDRLLNMLLPLPSTTAYAPTCLTVQSTCHPLSQPASQLV